MWLCLLDFTNIAVNSSNFLYLILKITKSKKQWKLSMHKPLSFTLSIYQGYNPICTGLYIRCAPKAAFGKSCVTMQDGQTKSMIQAWSSQKKGGGGRRIFSWDIFKRRVSVLCIENTPTPLIDAGQRVCQFYSDQVLCKDCHK